MSEPIHIISLGAGVQSSTMALMAAHGEITPMPKCAIFADTQDEPTQGRGDIYRWIEKLRGWLPFEIDVRTAGSLTDSALDLRVSRKSGKSYLKTSLPVYYKNPDGTIGMGQRTCTMDYKIAVIQKRCREIRNGSDQLIVWKGISLDEVWRMKQSRVNWITHRYPIIDKRMTRWACLQWMKDHGYPEPPRSACRQCPFHSDNEWRRLKFQQPCDFQIAVEFERKLQKQTAKATAINGIPFLHRSCVPLDQVDFSTDEDHGQQVMFGNECEGMCGV